MIEHGCTPPCALCAPVHTFFPGGGVFADSIKEAILRDLKVAEHVTKLVAENQVLREQRDGLRRENERLAKQADFLTRENSGLKSQDLESKQEAQQMHQECRDLMDAYNLLMESQRSLIRALQ